VAHDYEAIVREALTQPGKLSEAYSAFWEYSMGNQWLAMMQLGKAEPISTFPGWKALGRHVKKGSKAIELIMPVFKKAKTEVTGKPDEHNSVYFIARRNWFGLSMTDGQEYVSPPIPDFDIDRAIIGLSITVEPFQAVSGNSMGYAKTSGRTIAVNPLAFDKLKTTTHEIAHIILQSDLFSAHDTEKLPRDVKEVEAELTAYLVKSALGSTQNLEYSRGYIQNWLRDTTLDKIRFPKVYGAADAILKAGRPPQSADTPRSTLEPA
jgi:N-terminal domain of anti-restriction factor ArdC